MNDLNTSTPLPLGPGRTAIKKSEVAGPNLAPPLLKTFPNKIKISFKCSTSFLTKPTTIMCKRGRTVDSLPRDQRAPEFSAVPPFKSNNGQTNFPYPPLSLQYIIPPTFTKRRVTLRLQGGGHFLLPYTHIHKVLEYTVKSYSPSDGVFCVFFLFKKYISQKRNSVSGETSQL